MMLFRRFLLIVSLLSAIPVAGAEKRQLLLAATDASFEWVISGAQLPIMIVVVTDWCGPCQKLIPTIEALQAEMEGKVRFAVLDATANPKTIDKLTIMSIPSMMIFKDGQLMARLVGGTTKSALEEWINTTLSAAGNRSSQ